MFKTWSQTLLAETWAHFPSCWPRIRKQIIPPGRGLQWLVNSGWGSVMEGKFGGHGIYPSLSMSEGRVRGSWVGWIKQEPGWPRPQRPEWDKPTQGPQGATGQEDSCVAMLRAELIAVMKGMAPMTVELTLEQHRFEIHRSTYMTMFYNTAL